MSESLEASKRSFLTPTTLPQRPDEVVASSTTAIEEPTSKDINTNNSNPHSTVEVNSALRSLDMKIKNKNDEEEKGEANVNDEENKKDKENGNENENSENENDENNNFNNININGETNNKSEFHDILSGKPQEATNSTPVVVTSISSSIPPLIPINTGDYNTQVSTSTNQFATSNNAETQETSPAELEKLCIEYVKAANDQMKSDFESIQKGTNSIFKNYLTSLNAAKSRLVASAQLQHELTVRHADRQLEFVMRQIDNDYMVGCDDIKQKLLTDLRKVWRERKTFIEKFSEENKLKLKVTLSDLPKILGKRRQVNTTAQIRRGKNRGVNRDEFNFHLSENEVKQSILLINQTCQSMGNLTTPITPVAAAATSSQATTSIPLEK